MSTDESITRNPLIPPVSIAADDAYERSEREAAIHAVLIRVIGEALAPWVDAGKARWQAAEARRDALAPLYTEIAAHLPALVGVRGNTMAEWYEPVDARWGRYVMIEKGFRWFDGAITDRAQEMSDLIERLAALVEAIEGYYDAVLPEEEFRDVQAEGVALLAELKEGRYEPHIRAPIETGEMGDA